MLHNRCHHELLYSPHENRKELKNDPSRHTFSFAQCLILIRKKTNIPQNRQPRIGLGVILELCSGSRSPIAILFSLYDTSFKAGSISSVVIVDFSYFLRFFFSMSWAYFYKAHFCFHEVGSLFDVDWRLQHLLVAVLKQKKIRSHIRPVTSLSNGMMLTFRQNYYNDPTTTLILTYKNCRVEYNLRYSD